LNLVAIACYWIRSYSNFFTCNLFPCHLGPIKIPSLMGLICLAEFWKTSEDGLIPKCPRYQNLLFAKLWCYIKPNHVLFLEVYIFGKFFLKSSFTSKIQFWKWLLYSRFCTRVSIVILTSHSVDNSWKWASNTPNLGEKITLEIHLKKL